ncbi:MAG: site-specific DNA-methyltransferase [Nitrospira sp.]
MARETTHYDLSDAEKRDLVKLIEQGKPLPEKYRFLLFADKREVELVWNGKTREVCTAVLPFQTLEHIDEPRKEEREQEELAFDSGGRQIKGWTNKLIWGDNKLILSSLKAGALRRQIEDAGGLKLIYIDPPFDVGADFSMDIEIGGETFHKEPNLLEQIAYRDTWGRGADSFIAMIYERLILMRDLMSNSGSIIVHCDWRVSGFIRAVLDEIFGKDKIVGELIWKHQIMGGAHGRRLPKAHETLFWFKKTDEFKINESAAEIRVPFSEYVRSTMQQDAEGRWFYTRRRMSRKTTDAEQEAKAHTITYVDNPELGTLASDVWDDFPSYQPKPADNTKYPTQKPNELLERVIGGASNEGDLVADFFVDSGTTAAVAEKLGRKWIATDLGKFGIHTTRKRLIQVQRELKASGKPFRAFEVLNLGRYERQAYLNVSGRLTGKHREEALAQKEAEFRELILKAYRAEPLPETGFFHGKLASRLVVVGPINLPVGRLFIEEVITECRKRGASRVDVLAFEFEMGLFPAVLDEAKQKGIDLAPRTIPPEVFDKRAVEKGQVRFHDVAYIEVTPRFDKKDKLTLAIELTDFSVYYSQGIAKSIEAELKEGKSEVVCESGQLIKISKDKQGVVIREVLTKKWTDWVDYWAVDFNYESRKELIKVQRGTGLGGVQGFLPGQEPAQRELELTAEDFEERWTGAYIFENEWQSFRTRQNRDLELKTATHTYAKPGRYIIAVKVIDIFGNDTMTLVPVTAG